MKKRDDNALLLAVGMALAAIVGYLIYKYFLNKNANTTLPLSARSVDVGSEYVQEYDLMGNSTGNDDADYSKISQFVDQINDPMKYYPPTPTLPTTPSPATEILTWIDWRGNSRTITIGKNS